MNFEPFEPFESAEPSATPERPKPHYFDRPGLLWIAASLLFANLAGRFLPVLAEPDGLRQGLVAIGLVDSRQAAVASLPEQTVEHAKNQRQQATRMVSGSQGETPNTVAVLRQF